MSLTVSKWKGAYCSTFLLLHHENTLRDQPVIIVCKTRKLRMCYWHGYFPSMTHLNNNTIALQLTKYMFAGLVIKSYKQKRLILRTVQISHKTIENFWVILFVCLFVFSFCECVWRFILGDLLTLYKTEAFSCGMQAEHKLGLRRQWRLTSGKAWSCIVPSSIRSGKTSKCRQSGRKTTSSSSSKKGQYRSSCTNYRGVRRQFSIFLYSFLFYRF